MTDPLLTVFNFLKELKVNFSKNEIKKKLTDHPHYPSLLSVSDLLKEIGIPNYAYKPQDTINLPTPSIAHTKENTFILIKSVEGNKLNIFDGKLSLQISSKDFQESFNNVILIAEGIDTKQRDRAIKLKVSDFLDSYLTQFAIFFLVLSVLYLNYETFKLVFQNPLSVTFFFFAKVIGLGLSMTLLTQYIDRNNRFIKKICSSSKSSCDTVLTSKAATVLWGKISLSEIGYAYFSFTLLLFIFNQNQNSAGIYNLLKILNFCTLPFTVFSIYYQAQKLKKWCILCCAIQAILWIEFICLIALSEPLNFDLFTYNDFFKSCIALVIPIAIWVLVKKSTLTMQKAETLEKELKVFKNNDKLFSLYLNSQPKYRLLDKMSTIIVGNKNANNTVTLVLNPNCGSCGMVFKEVCNWIIGSDLDYKIQTIFTGMDEKSHSISYYMNLLNIEGKINLTSAIFDWYDQEKIDINTWKKNFPVNQSINSLNKYNEHTIWCNEIKLSYTPTILLNGYLVPEEFDFKTFKYYL